LHPSSSSTADSRGCAGSGRVGALSTFYPDAKDIDDPDGRYLQRVRLMAKLPTIAA
jgi:citrate synthase